MIRDRLLGSHLDILHILFTFKKIFGSSFRLLLPIAYQKTQNYDTSTECDVKRANLKIVAAFLAAILKSWTFYKA